MSCIHGLQGTCCTPCKKPRNFVPSKFAISKIFRIVECATLRRIKFKLDEIVLFLLLVVREIAEKNHFIFQQCNDK